MENRQSKYNPTVSFRLSQDTIDKLNKCLDMKNKETEKFGVTYKRADLVEDIIKDYYYQKMGQEDRYITDEYISRRIDETMSRFTDVTAQFLQGIHFNAIRNSRMLEMLIRITCGTREEQIEKRMRENEGFTSKDAERSLDGFIKNSLFAPAVFLTAMDKIYFSEQDDDSEEHDEDEDSN